MTLFRRRHVVVSDQEFDFRTGRWVRRGWVAERQALVDADFERWQRGERKLTTCNACGLPTDDHPMPERLWRTGPDLCAAARSRVGADR